MRCASSSFGLFPSTRSSFTPGRVAGCADRTAQVPGDPYSPPCVDFSGDNGGATSKGVSADTVTVSSRILSDTQSFLDTITQLTGGKITTSAEEARRRFYGLVYYFNTRFQFYGRKLKVDLFDGKGTATAELLGGGQEEAEADAVKVAQELKAFADTCLREYDLKGWTAPDLINPGRTSVLAPK